MPSRFSTTIAPDYQPAGISLWGGTMELPAGQRHQRSPVRGTDFKSYRCRPPDRMKMPGVMLLYDRIVNGGALCRCGKRFVRPNLLVKIHRTSECRPDKVRLIQETMRSLCSSPGRSARMNHRTFFTDICASENGYHTGCPLVSNARDCVYRAVRYSNSYQAMITIRWGHMVDRRTVQVRSDPDF